MTKKAKPKYEDYEYSSIKDAKTSEKKGDILKIVAFIKSLDDPKNIFDAKKKKRMISKAAFYDSTGEEIGTTIFYKKKYNRLYVMENHKEPVEIIAKIVEEFDKKSKFNDNKLKIIKFRSASDSLRRLCTTEDEIRIIKKYIKSRKDSGWTMLNEFKEAVLEETGTIDYAKDKRYRDAITAVICQAFSAGRLGKSNGKISNCVIGPPATGKGYLWEIAKLINVACEEGQPGTTTKAGVVGTIYRKGGKWDIDTGRIALANNGVYGIQDFDKAKDHKILLTVLSDVMDSGKIIISGAKYGKFETEVGVHLDLNRQSDLFDYYREKRGSIDDVNLPTNILDRLDFIVQLKDSDAETLQNKGAEILDKYHYSKDGHNKSAIAKFCRKNGIKEVERFLKLLVAYVTTNYSDIDTLPMRKNINRKYDEIWEANKNFQKVSPVVKRCLGRIPNGTIKYVRALTRLQLRTKANERAVNKSYILIGRKLQFLKLMDKQFKTPKFRKSFKLCFKDWLVNNYGSESFEREKALEEYKNKDFPCGEKSDSQIRKYVQKYAKHTKHKVWKIKSRILKEYNLI